MCGGPNLATRDLLTGLSPFIIVTFFLPYLYLLLPLLIMTFVAPYPLQPQLYHPQHQQQYCPPPAPFMYPESPSASPSHQYSNQTTPPGSPDSNTTYSTGSSPFSTQYSPAGSQTSSSSSHSTGYSPPHRVRTIVADGSELTCTNRAVELLQETLASAHVSNQDHITTPKANNLKHITTISSSGNNSPPPPPPMPFVTEKPQPQLQQQKPMTNDLYCIREQSSQFRALQLLEQTTATQASIAAGDSQQHLARLHVPLTARKAVQLKYEKEQKEKAEFKAKLEQDKETFGRPKLDLEARKQPEKRATTTRVKVLTPDDVRDPESISGLKSELHWQQEAMAQARVKTLLKILHTKID